MPGVPECAEHVWKWWFQLNARRAPGFDTLSPLSYNEIYSWIVLSGTYVTPEEIGWLIRMDNAWLTAIAQERADKREREEEARERQESGKRK